MQTLTKQRFHDEDLLPETISQSLNIDHIKSENLKQTNIPNTIHKRIN